MVSPPDRSLTELLDALASRPRAVSGVGAATLAAAMGLALFEKALATPAEGKDWQAGHERQVVTSLRTRLMALAAKDEAAGAAMDRAEALAAGPERAQATAGARLMAYRSARRLLDYVIQGLTLLQHPLDYGSPAFLTDIEAGRHLLGAAKDAAIAAAEDHLRELDPAFAAVERKALEAQSAQARDLTQRAEGALSWRRGKV